MASRALNDLVKSVYRKAEKFRLTAERMGVQMIFTCTYRSEAEQHALYSQGRKTLSYVNSCRLAVSLPGIDVIANSRIITYAKPGFSLHQYRCAFDVVPMEAGKCVWNRKASVWKLLGDIGVSEGLEWAGNWRRFKEYPHFQYIGELSKTDIREGKVPV